MIVQEASQDASQPPYTMNKARKLPLTSLNDYLTCKLCRGYYIDATTIIECLHTFCRSCIVKYLETNKYCPICDVQVHKTKPLINIRSDKILQSCVYKLVPRLFQSEMLRRKGFYAFHPEAKANLDVEELGEANYQHILAPDENICVALNYKDSPLTPRYLQCSAAVSIFHLQKLIRSKYDLSCNHRIDIFHEDDVLKSYLTLIDVAYTSLWRRRGPLELSYRIYESLNHHNDLKLNSTSDNCKSISNNNNNASNDWKEVQIQISENGEMSVTGIQDCLDLLDKMDDKSNKKETNTCEDSKPLKNSTSKITKVELNQPVSSHNSSSDVIMTISLPAVTLTASEIRELSKVEEAAKTQLSDAIILPPPAKKQKKELPDLKLIGSSTTNKSQKKNGAKTIASPQDTMSKPPIAQTSTNVTTYKPVNSVNVTSVTVIPASTVHSAHIEPIVTYVHTSSIPLTTSSSVSSSTFMSMSKDTIITTTAASIVAGSTVGVNTTLASSIKSIATIPSTTSTLNAISNVKSAVKSVTPLLSSSTKLSTNLMPAVSAVSNSIVKTVASLSTSGSKRKLDNTTTTSSSDQATAQKLPKPTILNHSLGMQKSLNLSKNHPLTTKHQKALESATAKAANNNNPSNLHSGGATLLNQLPSKWNAGAPNKTYGSLINVPKVPINKPQTSNSYSPTLATNMIVSQTVAESKQSSMDSSSLMIKSKASTPIGYKTLKDPPKTWNPTLQPVHLKPGGPATVGPTGLSCGKPGDLKNVRPAKFFKMRNNMPRYLGCPNSGVKPMFQVHVSPDKESKVPENTSTTSAINQTTPLINTSTSTRTTLTTTANPTQSSSVAQQPVINKPHVDPPHQQQHIRKHSIVKIDPKTLKPISEKAPESSNLSTKKTVASGVSEGEQKGVGTSVGKNVREQQFMGSPRSTGNDQQSPTTINSRPSQSTSTSSTLSSNLNLRINTTSVSITNPLKKSPHSPKKSNSPPTNQLLKSPPPALSSGASNKPPPLNQTLNFPSNPFIPNPLASPTLNPNQFNLLTAAAITAAAAQGYHHGFDPRYHHHLPYHHQLYPPRLPPFGPAGNWWGSPAHAGQQQQPLSASVNRNTSPRGLIWNEPSSDNKIASPKEAKTATSATLTSNSTSSDVALPRSTISSSNKSTESTSGTHNKSVNAKETNLKDSAHERKDEKSNSKAVLSESEEKIKPVSENVNKTAEKKSVSDVQSSANEKMEKMVQKNAATSDTPKENVVLAV